ncbi:hypothetical protein BIV57_02095 [Mangrovactinospora gilvigrisea]|uniref:CRISPR-associated protein n=1 Tax=Mangrovactinospora gilvigrisea TaxID=1428644 RepID=A0A1J7CC86_9ACTN|nr:hypothetical protein [Mangrovactinospora gilvigrisea]OIV39144.1 hypothetical protein BIV57_02095 [Mangrovactinospora gilvigrisea]
MTVSIKYVGVATALSSIAHAGGDRPRGTTTLLRREKIIQPDGRVVYVPMISGNSVRGRLRRIGEDLLREVLEYEGEISLAAAHALRGGGSLAKQIGQNLSGLRLAHVRSLIPQVGVFGCAAGGRVIDGCLQVGKWVPHYQEVGHIIEALGAPSQGLRMFDSTQVEIYNSQDDSDTHGFADLEPQTLTVPVADDGYPELDALPGSDAPSRMLTYGIETFPAGTQFSVWLALTRANAMEAAFFTDILSVFTADARVGGRLGAGHGMAAVTLKENLIHGALEPFDWRAHLRSHRRQAIDALAMLS